MIITIIVILILIALLGICVMLLHEGEDDIDFD